MYKMIGRSLFNEINKPGFRNLLTVIFYNNDEQKRLAENSKEALQKSGRYSKPIVTKILPTSQFYKAEEYHQDYHQKNPIRGYTSI